MEACSSTHQESRLLARRAVEMVMVGSAAWAISNSQQARATKATALFAFTWTDAPLSDISRLIRSSAAFLCPGPTSACRRPSSLKAACSVRIRKPFAGSFLPLVLG